MSNVTIQIDTGFATRITTRGLTIIADESLEGGGTNQGPDPQELLLGALGACAAITARMYAQRKGWALEGIEINVSTERLKASEYVGYTGTAAYINEFRQMIHFKGDLTDEQRERLLQIAGKCPVHRILTEENVMIEELLTDAVSFSEDS